MKGMQAMKKLLIAMLMILVLMTTAFAESEWTHYDGKFGFTMEYPADVFDLSAYGINVTLITKEQNDTANFTVLDEEEFTADPVAKLIANAAEFNVPCTKDDIRVIENDVGGKLYLVRIPYSESVELNGIYQEGDREIWLSAFMSQSVEDKYAPLFEKVMMSVRMDNDGDFSGRDEDMEDYECEGSFYDDMIEKYMDILTQYGQAVVDHLDAGKLMDAGLSPLLAYMADDPDTIRFDFISLSGTADYSLAIYDIRSAGSDTAIQLLAVYTKDADDKLVFSLISAERNYYDLYGSEEEGFQIANLGSNSAFESGVFYYQMSAIDKMELIESIITTANDKGEAVTYHSLKEGWDVTDAELITDEQAAKIYASYMPCTELNGDERLVDVIQYDMGIDLGID